MDIQLLLVFILSLLTVNLIIVGVYVVLVLREFRQTLKKANGVLDDVESITNAVTNPLSALSGIFAAILEGAKVVKSIRGVSSISKDDD